MQRSPYNETIGTETVINTNLDDAVTLTLGRPYSLRVDSQVDSAAPIVLPNGLLAHRTIIKEHLVPPGTYAVESYRHGQDGELWYRIKGTLLGSPRRNLAKWYDLDGWPLLRDINGVVVGLPMSSQGTPQAAPSE